MTAQPLSPSRSITLPKLEWRHRCVSQQHVPCRHQPKPAWTDTTDSGRLFHAGQILISTIGLPARGKTHISRSLERYLRWLGVRTKVFSLGDFRRDQIGPSEGLPKDYFYRSGTRSSETEALRKRIKDGLEEKIKEWFTKENGQVAIYDANVRLPSLLHDEECACALAD